IPFEALHEEEPIAPSPPFLPPQEATYTQSAYPAAHGRGRKPRERERRSAHSGGLARRRNAVVAPPRRPPPIDRRDCRTRRRVSVGRAGVFGDDRAGGTDAASEAAPGRAGRRGPSCRANCRRACEDAY